MSDLYRLPLSDRQGASCYVDPARGEWFVARSSRHASVPAAHRLAERGATDSSPAETLRHVWLYTNTDCNLACRHCLLPEHATRPPLSDLLARLDEAFCLGATTVFLTGGEPFWRDDLDSLLAFAAPRARTVVLTNGTLLTPSRLAGLDALGAAGWKKNLVFQVSVDGTRGSHDALRGTGSYDRAIAGIKALIEWGRPPTLSSAITRLNIGTVSRVTELCGRMGLGAHHLFLPHQTGRLLDKQDLVPTTEQLLRVVRRCRDVAEQAGVVLDNDAALSARVRRPGPRFLSCHGGRDMLAIGPDGAVYPCPSLVGHEAAGCDGSQGLRAALESRQLNDFRDHHVERREDCRACPVRFLCGGGCAAHSYWTGNRYEAPEPYCEIYRGLIEDRLVAESDRLIDEAGGLSAGGVLGPATAEGDRRGAAARFDCA